VGIQRSISRIGLISDFEPEKGHKVTCVLPKRGAPEQQETIHNWVFKVGLAVNHIIKNGFGIIPILPQALANLDGQD